MDKMREEFEEWCKINELRPERQRTMLGGDMGRYDFPPTQFSWEIWVEAWQASRKALVVELPQSCSLSSEDLTRVMEESSVVEALDAAGVAYK